MNSTARPLVSVLVRSTNRPTLTRALDSIADQSYPAIEILVVAASGSAHPPLPPFWRDRPLRYFTAVQPLSRSIAANVLVASASGRYVNFLDDDDELLPIHVETLVNALSANLTRRLAYSVCRVYDAAGTDVGRLGKPGHHLLMFHQNRFAIHAAMFNRSLIDQGIRFDAKFDRLEDLDFFIACGARTEFEFVPAETCVWHAFTGGSGMGFAGNFDSAQQERCTQAIRAKWRKQFETWGREPEGILAVAESAASFGRFDVAAKLFQKIRSTAWRDTSLSQRAETIEAVLINATSISTKG